MTLTEDLAAAILHTPAAVAELPVAETTRHLVDTLGCHFFGCTLPYPLMLLRDVAAADGACSIFGTGLRASVTDAAFLNAAVQSSFELDGGGAYVHPGPCVVPAVLAVAERAIQSGISVSGTDLIRAVAIGYETSVRVAEWVGFIPEREIGWHTPSFHGAIGAAAAAGAFLGLDQIQLAHTLAIAADMAGGGLVHSRNNAKRFHTARAAQTGVAAALLAERGIRGGLDVLEDPRWGYRRAMTYSGEGPVEIKQPNTAEVSRDFPQQWRAWDRIGIKYYPFHSAGQTILDNCRALVIEQGVDPAQVQAVRVGLSSFMYEHDKMLRAAADLGEANFSLPYAVAVGLLRHPARLTAVDGTDTASVFVTSVQDPDIRRLEAVVSFEASPELDAENTYTMDTAVTVTLADGTTATSRTAYGHAARARGGSAGIGFADIDREGIRRKFLNLAGVAVGHTAATELLAVVDNIADYSDLGDVIGALAKARVVPAPWSGEGNQ